MLGVFFADGTVGEYNIKPKMDDYGLRYGFHSYKAKIENANGEIETRNVWCFAWWSWNGAAGGLKNAPEGKILECYCDSLTNYEKWLAGEVLLLSVNGAPFWQAESIDD